MKGSVDFEPVLRALRDQGWQVELSSKGRYKAKPPNPDLAIVHFSDSKDHHALKNTVSRLRKSGFTWPSTPESDATHPEMLAAGETVAAAPSVAPAAADTSDERLERLWQEVKDARGYARLADDELGERGLALEQATRALQRAQEEHRSAVGRLSAAKAALDAALEEAR